MERFLHVEFKFRDETALQFVGIRWLPGSHVVRGRYAVERCAFPGAALSCAGTKRRA